MKNLDWFSLGDALNMEPPIYRLSERIRDLEKAGYEIAHDRVEGKTYGKYRILKFPEDAVQPTAMAVPSQSTKGMLHKVREVNGKLECSCPGFQFRKTCFHVQEAAKRSAPKSQQLL